MVDKTTSAAYAAVSPAGSHENEAERLAKPKSRDAPTPSGGKWQWQY